MKIFPEVINKDNLVFQVLLKNKINITILVSFSIISSFAELFFLKDMAPFIQDVISGVDVENFFIIRQIMLVCLWAFFGIMFRWKLAKFLALIGRDMSNLLISNIGSLSLMQVEDLGKSKITTLSTLHLDSVISGICNPLLRLIEIFFTILVGIIIIFLSLGFSSLPILFFGLFGLILLIYITKTKSYEYGLIDAKMTGKSIQTLNFFIENIKEVILQKDAKAYSDRFSKAISNKYIANGKGGFLSELPRKILETLLYLIICFLGLFKFFQTSNFSSSIPSLAVSLIVLQRITPLFQTAYRSIFSIINLTPILKEYNIKNSYDVFQKDLSGKSRIIDENKFYLKEKIVTSIKLRNLSVGHSQNELLKISNLSITTGSPLVILGKSGSGKTTLLETIIGLRPPIAGTCKFYNKNKILNEFRNISYVPQSSQLAGETLFEMISFNNKNLFNYKIDRKIEKLIIHTLDICCIKNDFIHNLHDLHRPINEGATSLSGGQRQRISIARALLKRNSILVLDEATNGLDEKLEELVISNIINEMESKILICVTHSSGLTKYFDNVLKLTD